MARFGDPGGRAIAIVDRIEREVRRRRPEGRWSRASKVEGGASHPAGRRCREHREGRDQAECRAARHDAECRAARHRAVPAADTATGIAVRRGPRPSSATASAATT